MSIHDYYSPREAADRWDVKISTLKSRLHILLNDEETMTHYQKLGYVKYYIGGKKTGTWTLKKDLMVAWYGPQPNFEDKTLYGG